MSATTTWDEMFLPWTESANDRRFKKILRITLSIFVVLGLILTLVPKPVPPTIKQDLKDVSPRLAKLIIEQKKQPPPPPPVPVPEKKPVEKAEKEKPPEPKEKPKDEPVPKAEPQKSTAQARVKASSSGLLALSNKLNTLHESFDVNDFSNVPLKKQGSSATKETNDAFKSDLITSGVTETSRGIGSKAVASSSGPTRLAERSTSNVQSSLNESSAPASKRISGGSARTESEIARVFEENKGAIYSMYNRALRGDPSLQGKVVLEITIEPDGSVSACRIVSSNLNNPEFEKKIISRVKLFRFKAGDIRQATIKYPIDFVPS